ncbi:MAG: hypothetical protein PWP25_1660 [Sphaerochaeta sp.]|jgi:hypothetical protein|nr:hypothetical protein [Sphaerochaeta sp.]
MKAAKKSRGSFTIPGETGYEELSLAKKWGLMSFVIVMGPSSLHGYWKRGWMYTHHLYYTRTQRVCLN